MICCLLAALALVPGLAWLRPIRARLGLLASGHANCRRGQQRVGGWTILALGLGMTGLVMFAHTLGVRSSRGDDWLIPICHVLSP